MRATSFPEFVEKHPSNYSPRLAGLFFPAYEKKPARKNVVAHFNFTANFARLLGRFLKKAAPLFAKKP